MTIQAEIVEIKGAITEIGSMIKVNNEMMESLLNLGKRFFANVSQQREVADIMSEAYIEAGRKLREIR